MKELTTDLPVFEFLESQDHTVVAYPEYVDAIVDRDGREYEHLVTALEDDDFYQGLNMITVLLRKSDGKIFGFSWWDDISKHGDSVIEANGQEFGLECDTDADDFDLENYVSYFVFEPVEPYHITAFRKV